MCMCMFMHTGMHAHMYMCVEARGQLWMSFLPKEPFTLILFPSEVGPLIGLAHLLG